MEEENGRQSGYSRWAISIAGRYRSMRTKQKRRPILTDVKIPSLSTRHLNAVTLTKNTGINRTADHQVPREIIHVGLSRDNVRTRARTNARNGNATRMDELAITPEPIRKRARIGSKCDAQTVDPTSFPITGIASLPVEIIFEIFSYLPYKDLYAVSRVSMHFYRLAYDPFLWRTYEVSTKPT